MRYELTKLPTLGLLLFLPACGDAPGHGPGTEAPPAADRPSGELAPEQEAFWARLLEHCGSAYAGEVEYTTPHYDGAREYDRLVAHFRACSDERIHIAVHVDDDRSRNWLLTRAEGTIRLKHDHRNEDGTEEEITQYGGDAPVPGLPHRQIFRADEHTARILPERHDNYWFMHFMDEATFAYGVNWPEQGHAIRRHFDLSTPVEPPPDPWGY